MSIIEALRTGRSTLRKPEKVVLAHTIVPVDLVPPDMMDTGVEWGCLAETTPGFYGVTLLGTWWLNWNTRN